jgi:hypothetical protein
MTGHFAKAAAPSLRPFLAGSPTRLMIRGARAIVRPCAWLADSIRRIRGRMVPDALAESLTNTEIGQNCCRNATPADNISRNVHNAQKVGRCLSFLLHAFDGAFQIAAS